MKKMLLIGLSVLLVGMIQAHGMVERGPGPMMGAQNLGAQVLIMPKQPLDQDEEQVLLKVFELKKLARDLYRELYEEWKLRIFGNLAISEQNHLDVLKAFLDKYDIQYSADDTTGTFKDQETQKLYDEWLEKSREGLEKALEVGAEMEEMSMYRMKEFLSQTDNDDVRIMLINMAHASARHLGAFNAFMTRYYGHPHRFQYLQREDLKEFYGPGFLERARRFLRGCWDRFFDER